MHRLARPVLPTIALALGACSSPPPPTPVDPCAELYAAYVAARVDACTAHSDCVHVSGIDPPRRHPDDESVMGPMPRPPCGQSSTREAAAAVEAIAARYSAAGCGPVGAPGSRSCSGFTHGDSPMCLEGHCSFPY